MPIPDTRPSLLLRIRDPRDRQAWTEFCALYRPVICRMAMTRGLQVADAEDLSQQVLLSISSAIDRYVPDASDARFRTWLKTIARNAIVNALTRRPVDSAHGGSGVIDLLHAQPDESGETQVLVREYRREIFRVAASMIRDDFQPETWQAFWESTVNNQSVESVAKRMGRSVGSVYTARSRVIKRLREKVQELDLATEEDPR